MFIELLYMAIAGLVGYVFTLILHQKLFSGSATRIDAKTPLMVRPTESVSEPIIPRKEKEEAVEEVKPRSISGSTVRVGSSTRNQSSILMRGATKDHVANLQKLKRGSPKTKRQVEDEVVVKPLFHPIFCPEVLPLSQDQESKIEELKKRVADVMIPFYAGRHTLVRFLGARQWDIDKAEVMLREAIKWRNGLQPIEKYVDLVSLSKAVQLSVVMDVKDKFGRPICYFVPRRHNANIREVDSALRVMVWFMDQLWRETRDTYYKKFVVLFNMNKFALRNNDLMMVRAFLPILQNYYPESVGRIIIVEYPIIIWGLWKVIKPLLDPNTQNKVQFISAEEMSDHFNLDTIPAEIGGKWEAPEPEVDLWSSTFDHTKWKKRPWEIIEEEGVYKIDESARTK